MKTLEQIKEQYKKNKCIDGRDLVRLSQFIPEEEFEEFGLTILPEAKGKHVPIPFTRENILIQLEKDVEFGFVKALARRGISSSLMYEVVKMWNLILEEGLEDFDNYAMYGLPLFKATAIKYGWNNPIGNDSGEENKYSDDGEEY